MMYNRYGIQNSGIIMRIVIKHFLVFLLVCLVCEKSFSEDWQPFSLSWDKAPVDLRTLLDVPAGKHGYLGFKQKHFVFEDGTPFRPWGVTVSGDGCFPMHEQAPYLADRLANFGINIVRFQNLDSPSIQPPLIQTQSPITFHREQLDRLDYFIYQLESRGIYVCFDGLQSLELNVSSEIAEWQRVQPGLKSYVHFIPELQAIYAEFLEVFWTHRNRYINGKQLRDIPNVVFTHLFHDNQIDTTDLTIPAYNFELYSLWVDWLEQNGYPQNLELDYDNPTKENQRFLTELNAESLSHWYTYLRSLNVKTLIGGDSIIHDLSGIPIQWNMDFMGPSGEWNQPLGSNLTVPPKPMLAVDLNHESHLFSELAVSNTLNKPMFITGWGEPFPNPYRAELPLWTAIIARWQDWQGAISNTVSSNNNYSQQHFTSPQDQWVDPLVMGLMPAASVLFHQQGLQPARSKITMNILEDHLYSNEPLSVYKVKTTRMVEQAQVQTSFNSKSYRANILLPTMPEAIDDVDIPIKQKPFERDLTRGLLLIDTPQVKAMVGGVNQATIEDIPELRIRTDEPFAIICAASLDQKELNQSNTILITVVSEAKNTGMITLKSEIGISMIRFGNPPVLIKDTPCRIYVKTQHENAQITVIDANGNSISQVPLQIQDGWVSFSAGTHGSIYYRLSCFSSE